MTGLVPKKRPAAELNRADDELLRSHQRHFASWLDKITGQSPLKDKAPESSHPHASKDDAAGPK